jgi:hypothetical protein
MAITATQPDAVDIWPEKRIWYHPLNICTKIILLSLGWAVFGKRLVHIVAKNCSIQVIKLENLCHIFWKS